MNKIFLVVIVLGLVACKDVIEVELPNKGARLVVEASINWEKGMDGRDQVVKLSNSSSYFGKDKKFVKGAMVSITNEKSGVIFNFKEKENGEYWTDSFIPVIGDTYVLSILHEGKKYEASEKMMSVSNIDSVRTSEYDFFKGKVKSVEAYYNDPKEFENYYFSVFRFKKESEFAFRNDRLTNGNKNKVRFSDSEMKKGDTVRFSFYGVSKRYYKYMRILSSQAGTGSGAPFQSPPAKLYGNCKNVNDTGEDVLGYFRLSEVVKKEYIVE